MLRFDFDDDDADGGGGDEELGAGLEIEGKGLRVGNEKGTRQGRGGRRDLRLMMMVRSWIVKKLRLRVHLKR